MQKNSEGDTQAQYLPQNRYNGYILGFLTDLQVNSKEENILYDMHGVLTLLGVYCI